MPAQHEAGHPRSSLPRKQWAAPRGEGLCPGVFWQRRPQRRSTKVPCASRGARGESHFVSFMSPQNIGEWFEAPGFCRPHHCHLHHWQGSGFGTRAGGHRVGWGLRMRPRFRAVPPGGDGVHRRPQRGLGVGAAWWGGAGQGRWGSSPGAPTPQPSSPAPLRAAPWAKCPILGQPGVRRVRPWLRPRAPLPPCGRVWRAFHAWAPRPWEASGVGLSGRVLPPGGGDWTPLMTVKIAWS